MSTPPVSDREKRESILDKIRHVIGEAVNARYILFPRYLRDPLRDAWAEISRPTPDDPNDLITKIKKQIEKTPPRILKDHGMEGKQLHMKYLGSLESYNELDKDGGISRFKRFVKWAKLILGSLNFIPGVEIIKELIETIDHGIEMSEETWSLANPPS
jgi:hypothetical protein